MLETQIAAPVLLLARQQTMLLQEIETAKVAQQFRKSNPLIRKFAKNKPKNKQFLDKTSPKISNPHVTKKNANSENSKSKFAGKTQGWQHCFIVTLTATIYETSIV